jgi:hypothetical protein
VLSATSSLAEDNSCEPVEIKEAGYVRDGHGEYMVVPGTNLTKYQVVMKRCKRGFGTWSSRTYHGYADSIAFPPNRYWCVRFLAKAKRYIFVKDIKKEDCY